MRSNSRISGRRCLRIEALEDRSLPSAVPTAAGASTTAAETTTTAGDVVVPFHAQVGSSALETILGVTKEFSSLEQAVDAYLNSVPGWHLSGTVDTTPSYSGSVDGSLVVSATGILKSASVTLTGSADIAGSIEGYYGISVLHVGAGVAADLSANIQVAASYTVSTNTWYFAGSASVDGYVKGYASAMAWPLKGEVYIRGDLEAAASIDSTTGMASARVTMVGSVGADAQMRSLFGGWTTIASVSKNLGSYGYSATFNVGQWLQTEVYGVAAANQTTKVTAVVAVQNEKSDDSDTTLSLLPASKTASEPTATTTTVKASVYAVAVQQLSTEPLFSSGYFAV